MKLETQTEAEIIGELISFQDSGAKIKGKLMRNSFFSGASSCSEAGRGCEGAGGPEEAEGDGHLRQQARPQWRGEEKQGGCL